MAGNPNPAAISEPLWGLWTRLSAHDKRLKLGGIYAAKTGYHDRRNAVSTRDYSVGEVPADRNGPGDKASAIDLTPADQAGMRLYTTRLDAAARARDERLFIGGVPIIREFIGTKNGVTVYCWVLTGGRARGLPADSGVDFGRDDTHLWHVHVSIIRQFCADQAAMDRLYSVLTGESLAAWRARTGAGRTESSTVQEDDMSQQVIQVPNGHAYGYDGLLIARQFAVSIPVEPAGFAENKIFGSKRLYLSAACDHTAVGAKIRFRVAVWNGEGWTVDFYEIASGGRLSLRVPVPKNGTAFNITVGRAKTSADAPPSETEVPLSVLATVA